MNSLLEDVEGGVVYRILFINAPTEEVALIDVKSHAAWPEWKSFQELELALNGARLRLRKEDPWYADVRADEELSSAARRRRDERLAVIGSLTSLEADPDQRILRADGRGRLVHAAHLATGKAEDKIYGWLRQFWQRGQTDNALLPDFERCGKRKDGGPRVLGAKKLGRPPKLALADSGRSGLNVTEAVRVLLVRGGTRYWKRPFQGKRLTLREAFERTLQDYFSKRLELRDGHLIPVVWESPDDDGRLPTFRQFCYWLGKERNLERDLKERWGERRWALTHRPVLGSSEHLSKGPGDLYLIDATIGDVYLVSSIDPRWVIGRPVLYLVIDHFTRMIVGLYVGLEGPSWMGAMMALESALTEKVSFCARYGIDITEEDWPCHHIPRQIAGDRGEMLGAPSDGLVPGLRIIMSNMPSFRADFKSYVEGQFKISNDTGIRRMPGWVDKLRGRGDADYRLDAQLDLHHFTRLMIELALHNNKRRRLETQLPPTFPIPRGMDPRPLDLWEWGMAHHLGAVREFPRERVRVNLLPIIPAVATVSGIAIHGGLLHYDSATAREAGWFAHARGRQAKRLQVSLDERDISCVFLRLEGGRRIEVCPLTSKDEIRFAGKSLAEVLDQRDRFQIARRVTRGERHQEESEHQARLDAIVASARDSRREKLGVPNGERTPAPFAKDIREQRRTEREQRRTEQAFSRDSAGPPESTERADDALALSAEAPTHGTSPEAPTRAVHPTDDDEYVPFPS